MRNITPFLLCGALLFLVSGKNQDDSDLEKRVEKLETENKRLRENFEGYRVDLLKNARFRKYFVQKLAEESEEMGRGLPTNRYFQESVTKRDFSKKIAKGLVDHPRTLTDGLEKNDRFVANMQKIMLKKPRRLVETLSSNKDFIRRMAFKLAKDEDFHDELLRNTEFIRDLKKKLQP